MKVLDTDKLGTDAAGTGMWLEPFYSGYVESRLWFDSILFPFGTNNVLRLA